MGAIHERPTSSLRTSQLLDYYALKPYQLPLHATYKDWCT